MLISSALDAHMDAETDAETVVAAALEAVPEQRRRLFRRRNPMPMPMSRGKQQRATLAAVALAFALAGMGLRGSCRLILATSRQHQYHHQEHWPTILSTTTRTLLNGNGSNATGEGSSSDDETSSSNASSVPFPFPSKASAARDAWYLADEVDDFFDRTYVNTSGLHALHGRDISAARRFFHPVCGRYRFDDALFPPASVVVTVQDERRGLLSLTVQSILARTPPALLAEIVIVDDNGLDPDLRADVNETEFADLLALSPKVKIVKNDDREGCARSRLAGARHATAPVLVFVDSHVEMFSSTWLQHLLVPVMEDPRTVALQSIDVLADVGDRHEVDSAGGLMYGTITDDLLFSYQAERFEGTDHAEHPSKRLPYETPFGPGSLFAVMRDEFWRLGGYDEGLAVWGGENVELAFKSWMCGGRLVQVPCSRVGHVYRVHYDQTGRWPPKLPQKVTDRFGCNHTGNFFLNGHNEPADNFTKIILRNNIRVLNLWVGKDHPAKAAYYQKHFGTGGLPGEPPLPPEWRQYEEEVETDEAGRRQRRIKAENGCRDFDWFDRHVLGKLLGRHHPWHPSSAKLDQRRSVDCGNGRFKAACSSCTRGARTDQRRRIRCGGDCQYCSVGGDGDNGDGVARNGTVSAARHRRLGRKHHDWFFRAPAGVGKCIDAALSCSSVS